MTNYQYYKLIQKTYNYTNKQILLIQIPLLIIIILLGSCRNKTEPTRESKIEQPLSPSKILYDNLKAQYYACRQLKDEQEKLIRLSSIVKAFNDRAKTSDVNDVDNEKRLAILGSLTSITYFETRIPTLTEKELLDLYASFNNTQAHISTILSWDDFMKASDRFLIDMSAKMIVSAKMAVSDQEISVYKDFISKFCSDSRTIAYCSLLINSQSNSDYKPILSYIGLLANQGLSQQLLSFQKEISTKSKSPLHLSNELKETLLTILLSSLHTIPTDDLKEILRVFDINPAVILTNIVCKNLKDEGVLQYIFYNLNPELPDQGFIAKSALPRVDENIIAEIPAFLYCLLNDKITNKRKIEIINFLLTYYDPTKIKALINDPIKNFDQNALSATCTHCKYDEELIELIKTFIALGADINTIVHDTILGYDFSLYDVAGGYMSIKFLKELVELGVDPTISMRKNREKGNILPIYIPFKKIDRLGKDKVALFRFLREAHLLREECILKKMQLSISDKDCLEPVTSTVSPQVSGVPTPKKREGENKKAQDPNHQAPEKVTQEVDIEDLQKTYISMKEHEYSSQETDEKLKLSNQVELLISKIINTSNAQEQESISKQLYGS